MSEKKWKLGSRVPHKYRGGRRGKGSEFPRRGMNEYEGERLAMGKHRISKHRTETHNKRYGWASLHEKYIEGLLNKYLNKPYNEMLSEFYAKTKSLRQSSRQRTWDTQSYFAFDLDGCTHYRYATKEGKKYYVDDNGILRLKGEYTDIKPKKKLTRKQKVYNRQVPVPTFDINFNDFLSLKQKYNAVGLFVGEYYVIVEEEVLKMPIYTSPKSDGGGINGDWINVGGYNFDAKFNNVFWIFTYKVENSYKNTIREELERMKQENNPENADQIAGIERRLNTMKDYWTRHGSMELEFYTMKNKTSQ